MAIEESTLGLLSTLTTALGSAASTFSDEKQSFLAPADGISLLDVKNDLLLSYLQNLTFLIILKLRNVGATEDESSLSRNDGVWAEAVQKLVELRVYLERGVRPLENKLKYQIDKVVRAAEDVDRRTARKALVERELKGKPTTKSMNQGSDVSGSESEEDEGVESSDKAYNVDGDASVGPRPSALLRGTEATKTVRSTAAAAGTYKPPRITPTSMPEPATKGERTETTSAARKRRSQLLDEYIDEELSTAPRAQPSIGSNSTIVQHGRGAMSARDRDREKERVEYEERNFTRLPAESKAERKKARVRGAREQRDMFGGEDWTGLGGLGDRIHRSVAGGSRGNALERREKRHRETYTEDGPRGDGAGGVGIGDSFEKRRKILQQRTDKKQRRK
jgi:U3 small nucleolar ribonucleoprotein protein LCP5